MIRALVLDVDGVLSDGGVILDAGDGEAKRFHSRDGVGIRLAHLAGWKVLFLTARNSQPARRRAEELGAEWAIGIPHKERFLDDWLAERGIGWEETAYVGDDLQDLAVLRRVGRPVAVADAVPEVKGIACYVTQIPGGSGAVRDAVEWLLDQEGLKEKTVAAFVAAFEGFGVGREERGGAS